MSPSAVRAAEAEARRFLASVAALKKKDRAFEVGGPDYIYSYKESAAVKRSSMDLTRALADLRQNRKGAV